MTTMASVRAVIQSPTIPAWPMRSAPAKIDAIERVRSSSFVSRDHKSNYSNVSAYAIESNCELILSRG
jgi:hypothetical protein